MRVGRGGRVGIGEGGGESESEGRGGEGGGGGRGSIWTRVSPPHPTAPDPRKKLRAECRSLPYKDS